MARKFLGTLISREGRDRMRFARFTRIVIRIIAVALGAIFTFLQTKDIQLNALLTPVAADVIWRAALVIYYWAWVLGLSFDTNMQEMAYVSFPGQGKWPIQAIGVLIVFVIVATVLLWSHGDVAYFSLALMAFFLVDHASWLYLRYFLKPSINQSRAQYLLEKQYYELEILKAVEWQIFGDWKLWRLVPGAVIVLVSILFAFNRPVHNAIVNVVNGLMPWLAYEGAALVFYSSLVLLFVVLMEVWIWTVRISTMMRVNTLDQLALSYDLSPR